MNVTVEFTCPKCGLWTPGMAEFPDDVDVRRQAHLVHKCLHCGEPLEIKARVSELLKKAEKQ